MFKITIITILLASFGVALAVASWTDQPLWEHVAAEMGGAPRGHDEAGNKCYWFDDSHQLVCYHEWRTWLGFVDAEPVSLNGRPL